MNTNLLPAMAVIEQAGLPALRVAFTVAAAISLVVGGFILRRRHQFFDADPNIDDPPAARHNRAEEIFFVWTGLTVVLLCIVYELWSA